MSRPLAVDWNVKSGFICRYLDLLLKEWSSVLDHYNLFNGLQELNDKLLREGVGS